MHEDVLTSPPHSLEIKHSLTTHKVVNNKKTGIYLFLNDYLQPKKKLRK